MRLRAAVFAAFFACWCGRVFQAQSDTSVFASSSMLELTLEAPLTDLFTHSTADKSDDKYEVSGTLTYRDPGSGQTVVLRDVHVSERGHTSRNETECTFPKLKLRLPRAERARDPLFGDLTAIRIGTHCGESSGSALTPKYGRLANELSPERETLVYQLLAAIDAPTLRARSARITYRDGRNAPLVRHAMVLEDDADAVARLGGGTPIDMEHFGNVESRHAGQDALRVAFAEAMIGNFDWCLKFTPDDIYRCDASKPLWNMLAFPRGGETGLVMKDFDLAGIVVGRHKWFGTVYNPAFVTSRSPIEIEALSQVQRTRSLFPRAALDAERHRLLTLEPRVTAVMAGSTADAHGLELARQYVDAFYSAIRDDAAFYRPIVATPGIRVYKDASRTREACGIKDVMRPGTPVRTLQQSGSMSQVVVLDVMWRWAEPHACTPIQTSPVWIDTSAITSKYPDR